VSEALERARVAVARLKVFPLPSLVLLPGSALPLHIFEPRYRALLADALATDKLFAMAQVIPGQEERDGAELEPMLCVGTIALHQGLDDGRSNLLLAGVARARLVRELPQTKAYREVEAVLLEDAVLEETDPDEVALRSVVNDLIARLPTEVAERVAQVTTRVRGGALADVLASTIMDDVMRRFEILNETDVRERMRVVAQETNFLIGSLEARKPEGLLN
jgi:Lon protease-like protein